MSSSVAVYHSSSALQSMSSSAPPPLHRAAVVNHSNHAAHPIRLSAMVVVEEDGEVIIEGKEQLESLEML